MENFNNEIECFCCGMKFNFDFSKVPSEQKTVYIKCPYCGAEIKRGIPNHNAD